MAEINYGKSPAELAAAQAAAYEQGGAATLADVNREIAAESARMEAAIVAGMSPEETAGMNARINALKERAANVIASSQGAYQFAQEQAKASADLYATQMEELQTAQRNLAAQALGQGQAVSTPGGGYNRFTAEGTRAIRENAAAAMAAIGGEGGVPGSALVPTTGLVETTGTGLTGIERERSLLFGRALTAGQSRALAEIQGQQMALATQLELQASEAAREREAKERARVSDFKTSMFQYATQLAAQIGTTLADLKAKAAGADTRTGKQIADAELKLYERKAGIDWKNTMKEIAARAKAQGVSPAEQAAIIASANRELGSSNLFAKTFGDVVSRLQYVPKVTSDPIARQQGMLGKYDKETKSVLPISFDKKDRWYYADGLLQVDTDGAGEQPLQQVDVQGLLDEITAKLGELSTIPANKRAKAWDDYYSDPAGMGNKYNRRAMAVLFGDQGPLRAGWWLERAFPKTTQTVTAAPKQATTAKISFTGYQPPAQSKTPSTPKAQLSYLPPKK